MQRILKTVLIVIAVFLMGGIYLYGSIQNSKLVNTDMKKYNQLAYLDFAKRAHQTNYAYSGDRSRMPAYPFLQALFYNEKLDDMSFFEQGKYVNIILSIIILFILFFIFQKYLNLLYSISLVLILAFAVFIFKAAYFQAELLFYFFNFLGFLLMLKMLEKPDWKLGIVTGVVLGLAHLTKASVIPGLLVFLMCAIAKLVCAFFCKLQEGVRHQLLGILFVVLAFLVTVGPYISESKRIFGSYFYNVNSTFYFWADSWEECKAGPRAHGDRIGWPKMPPELIPSFKKYSREHGIKQISKRICRGMFVTVKKCYLSWGYFKYACIYGIFLLGLLVKNIGGFKKIIGELFFLKIFCLLYFLIYFLLYSWYAQISNSDRFILAQFIPFLFIISVAIANYTENIFIKLGKFKINISTFFNLLILCVFIFDWFSLPQRVLVKCGGV